MRLPVLIYLFNEISGMSATPAELVQSAKCFSCIPQSMQMPTLIYLAGQISEGGTGGGGVESGAGDPVAPPTGTASFYYNTTDSSFWAWNSTSNAWDKIIA